MKPPPLDTRKFENAHQIGGIRTGTLDAPDAGGSQGGRVAHFDTGAGLRFTVAIDRGGDIVDASFNRFNLAYLTPNGYKLPNPAYHVESEWLRGWPGGLLTTCGPQYIGHPRIEDDTHVDFHGHHSNTPAAVESVINPDPARKQYEMSLGMIIRDSRMFGPVVEVRRQIRCVLGVPEIHIDDEVTNRGNTRCAHHWLYHVNVGYPLLDRGARFIYRGRKTGSWNINDDVKPLTRAQAADLKRVSDPLTSHAGEGGRFIIIDPVPDKRGRCHVGLINEKIGVALELDYPVKDLPRLANWHHYGRGGSYVSGIEPFSGSLMGTAQDNHPTARQYLAPGESRRYRITIRIHEGRAAFASLRKHDGPVHS